MYVVMTKYDTLIHFLGMGDEVWHAGFRTTIVVSRIGRRRGRLSFLPSLLLQGNMGMGEPHSLLAMYASVAKREICDHD